MPRPHTTMRQIRQILRLKFEAGLSLRLTARSLSMPLTSVAECIQRAKAAGISWPIPEDLDDEALKRRLYNTTSGSITRSHPDFAYVKRELAKKGVTLQLLWLEHLESHPGNSYSYSQFCHLYRVWRRHLSVTMRHDHKAAEKLFVDFPGLRIPIYDEHTLKVSFYAELFVAVLGASSYLYCEALRSQELIHWVNAHVHAFEFMNGCPKILVPDNLHSAVTKAHRYEPDLNATYLEMAQHYKVVIMPARPYKPRDKAKVESGVQLVERWIIAVLRNRHFTSLAGLNEVIADLVERVNIKPFKKIPGSRRSLFEELDRPALRPLPLDPYEFATWKKAKVSIDYHFESKRHYYSVPYQLVGEIVEVRTSANTIEVFFNNQRVASHQRSYLAGRHTTNPAHMPASHRHYLEWTPERILAWARKNGPATEAFIDAIMKSRPHREQGYRSALGVLSLEKKYGATRLENACERALQLKSFSYKSVASILQHRLDQQPLRHELPRPRVKHHNLRGPNYYQ